ncbi:MAG: LytTR family transcriptional regulator DNA-binding domain-containing protein [Lachnospiraceae bacterium]|nr:LytTR family transcriptional regulator DNA-binding domain-containing protein [Lachnospiraceae bacterium]
MKDNGCNPSSESIVLMIGREMVLIPFEKIEYIETVNKRYTIHFVDINDNPLIVRSQDLEKQFLARPEFIRSHRSYIVNLNRIRTMEEKKLISLNEKVIPVASLHEAKVKAALVKRLYEAVRN